MLLTPFNADSKDEKTQAFVKKYQDKFGEVGSRDFLAEKFGINAAAIVKAAEKAVANKK